MNADAVKNEKEIKIKDNIERFDIKTIFNIKTYDATLSLSIKPYKDFPSNLIAYGEIIEIPRRNGTEHQVEGNMQINSTAKTKEEMYGILQLFRTYLTGILQNVDTHIMKIEKEMEEDDSIN